MLFTLIWTPKGLNWGYHFRLHFGHRFWTLRLIYWHPFGPALRGVQMSDARIFPCFQFLQALDVYSRFRGRILPLRASRRNTPNTKCFGGTFGGYTEDVIGELIVNGELELL